MQVTQQDYLDQYGRTADTMDQIEGMIGELRKLCESLKDWRKAARELASHPRNHPEWSDNLKKALDLGAILVRYHEQMAKLEVMYNDLKNDNKQRGLAEPQTLGHS